MEMYLLKSAACLAILLLFYKAFLEKESFHTFKRFYLLGALLVSFCIPLITLIKYVEPEIALGSFLNPIDEAIMYPTVSEAVVEQPFDWSSLLWSIYGLGVLFFGTRFIINLSRIVIKIKSNTKTKRESFINVLLKDLVIPHTFFNYIFLNKSKFEKQEIPEEVLLHEQTHAKQKHSIDILIIEFLQVIFWFNPILYLIKKDIKLNHEFLADQAVMNHGTSLTTYQQILLAFSSNATEPQLANAINYSSIKKRFKVMKTQTSKKNLWVKSLVLLPLLTFMVYGFSTTKEIEKEVTPLMEINPTEKHTARSIDLKILEDGNYSVDGIKVTKNMMAIAVNKLHQDITPEIRNNIMNVHVSSSNEVSNEETWFIYNSLLDYGFYRIVTPNQEVVRGKGNTPFLDNVDYEEQQKPPTLKEVAEYNTWAKKINTKTVSLSKDAKSLPIVEEKNLIKYVSIYNRMTQQQKEHSEEMPFPGFEPKNAESKFSSSPILKQQKSATREQMAEYNKLAKHYNAMIRRKGQMIIKVKDMERLKYIYSIMSEKQREDAEPFPNFPDPPPPPPAPNVLKVSKEDVMPPPPPIPPNATPEQRKRYQKVIDDYNNDVPPPPPPPTAKTGYKSINGKDYYFVKDKRGTRFYNRFGIQVDEKGNELNDGKQTKSGDVIPDQYVSKVYKDGKVMAEFDNSGAPPPPPPPPAPPTMEELAEKGASFYLEGKRITSEEAIKIVNKNKKINIQIRDHDSNKPVVKLSTKPIRL